MNKSAYYDLKDMLCRELEQVANKGELSAGELDVVDKLTHSIKSIETIMAMEDSGYSNDGMQSGNSYARKRDSRGRYSRDYYSRDGRNMGYSRDSKTRMIEQLEDLMHEAETDTEKDLLRNCINQMR